MERTKAFKIGGKQFIAKFPNVGQIIDIDSLKQALSGNRYGSMAASGLTSAYYALDLIDAISFYQVVCPEVARYYNIRNYTELELDKIEELLTAWKEQIQPWYIETMNSLRNISKRAIEDAESVNAEG